MIVGVDFDNTIVCYDPVFYALARERNLIPENSPCSKGKIRDYLRNCGKEDAWTEMQGTVYGPGMQGALPYPGVIEFFLECKKRKITVYVISHKTLYPFEGPKYNLHESAQKWLADNGFYDPLKIGLSHEQVFFALTKEEKFERIKKIACTYFVDDLPEFLLDSQFPEKVGKILFDPNQNYPHENQLQQASSWKEISKIIFQ